MKNNEIADKCFNILRKSNGLPAFALRQGIGYTGTKNMTIVLRNDGRFRRIHDARGINIWEIKECFL